MYAYCNNHPVGTADYDGHVLSIVLSILYIAVAIVLSVVWVCFVAPVLMDHQNSGYATPYMERDLIETVPSTPSVGNILNKEEVKSKFKDDAEETTETGVEGESGKETITSNKNNIYDNTPSKKHSTTTDNPVKGQEPNSSVDIYDKDGNIVRRRWFDSNGDAQRDLDYTNHGNSKQHPEWPHEHFWDWNKRPPRQ